MNSGRSPCPRPRASAFTLVELVMVIAIAGAVAVMIGAVMSRPLQGFVDQSRRVELVDLATSALNRMARDVRLAVPNSLRAPNNQTFELLAISEAGRYRANLLIAGGVRNDPPRCPPAGTACTIPVLSPGITATGVAAARWMVLYNVGSSSQGDSVWPPFNPNAAATPAVITPNGVAFTLNAGEITLGGANVAGFRFKFASPQHRFYLARDVLGYSCVGAGLDANGNGTGAVRRASFQTLANNYAYNAGNSAVLVDSVASCEFVYAAGTNTRSGLITLRLGLARGGEQINVLQQVHVDNAP